MARIHAWRGKTFFVMGVLGDPCYAEQAGIRTCRDPEAIDSCDGVLVGEKPYDWETIITAVFNFLIRHPDAPLVVPNPDMFFAVGDGRLHPASGATSAFVKLLCEAYGCGVEPLFLGKPYAPIFTHAHRHLEALAGQVLERDKVLIVGDSLASDIEGGHRFGYRTALMLTGVTTRSMLTADTIAPDLIFEQID
jgi:ribonucleotide monophosphatase NagD (HAD superfamily)